MVYHNLLGSQFTGDSALEVLQSWYNTSLKGAPDQTFDDWSKTQISLCQKLNGQSVEDFDTEDHAQKFLDILIESGDVLMGPYVQPRPILD